MFAILIHICITIQNLKCIKATLKQSNIKFYNMYINRFFEEAENFTSHKLKMMVNNILLQIIRHFFLTILL